MKSLPDIPAAIATYNQGREAERLAMKFAKMRASPFAFLRGSCHLFYQQLPLGDLPAEAPQSWLCGDLHLENFGGYKGDHRQICFDINDFDEAALGPCILDPLRFLVSIHLGTRFLALEKQETAALCQQFLTAYADTLIYGKARRIEHASSDGPIRKLLDDLDTRKRRDFLEARAPLQDGRRQLRLDGRKALPVSKQQREQVSELIASFASNMDKPGFFRVIDIARRIAGTGSLGRERFVILVEGKGSPDGNALLDLKEVGPSCLITSPDWPQPPWSDEAARVIAVQQRMQAVSPAFMHPVHLDNRPCILRTLLPSEDRVELERKLLKKGALSTLLGQMGQILGWDQLRSSDWQGSASKEALIDFGQHASWQKTLTTLAEALSAQAEADWRQFASAFDDGYFRTATLAGVTEAPAGTA